MGSANKFQAASERVLLAQIERNDIAIHDLIALAYDLCEELERLPIAARDATLARLKRAATAYRTAGASPEAALLDVVLRHLHRYFAPSIRHAGTVAKAAG
ncbi:hypothetical protein E4K72_22825 [Oxalobacteraceae bacterium OM1]|nr:hypothetical protein E4K72_22825 [Oxalobacteraceae bacterium OM1]